METAQSASGGIGLGGVLTVVFVIFKLLGKLDWSWWWVFSPLWIPALAILAFILICLFVALVVEVLK